MYFDRIIDAKRHSWAGDGPPAPMRSRTRPASAGRLRNALRGDHVALIAEVKPRSPSKGELWPLEQAAALARTYAAGGASAVSVLADEEFFGGSPALVRTIATDLGVDVPVLYKDFVVDVRQVDLAHASGADGLLIIVRALDDALLRDVTLAARERGLDPLHECFTERDLDRAMALDPDLIGINNRDLQSFRVDLEIGRRLRALVPPGVVTVSESGLASAVDIAYVARHGFDACLVGEALLTSGDISRTVAEMSAVSRPRALQRR